VRTLLKKLALALFGDYQVYWIYCYELAARAAELVPDSDARVLSAEEVRALPSELAGRAHYAGEGAFAFGLFVKGELAAVAWGWDHKRYQYSLWPIQEGEAFMMDVFTLPRFRGQGLGARLMKAIAREMLDRGYRRAYATVWFTHDASSYMMTSGGWRRVAIVLELHPFGRRRGWRLQKRLKSP
jgi:GNAT superfamily N-acetyltransferase